jgi:Tol biopolymer transport system component
MVASPAPPPIISSFPSVSPNGAQIAYWRRLGNAKRESLIVMQSDGTHQHAVATARNGEAAWSPDGKLLAYNDFQIYVVPAAGGTPRRLTHEPRVVGGLSGLEWTDAHTIHYYVNDCCFLGGVPYYYTATVTLGRKQVDNEDEADCAYHVDCPVPSPDGSRRFALVDGTWQLSGAGLAQPIDLPNTDGPGWSPTGRWATWGVVIDSYYWAVVANGDGTHQTLITWNGAPAAHSVAWSPTEAELAFETSGKLFVAAGDGTNAHPVATESTTAYVGGPWSAHGRWLVYPHVDERHVVTTMVIRPDGTSEHALVKWKTPIKKSNGGYAETWSSPDWAPNDAFAAYEEDCGHGEAIYRVDAATGRSRRLTACR